MTAQDLHGVIAAIATPFDIRSEPDLERFRRLARHLLDSGCDGLNVCGTTGEATSMSVAQRMAVMEAAASCADPRRLMFGTGAAALADAIALTRHAGELGAAGALLIPPFYFKAVDPAGVAAYVEAVAEATRQRPVPLYLYHFPALSGVPYTPDLVQSLHRRLGARLKGLKDSSGDQAYARAVASISPDLAVFPSNEATLMDARDGPFAGCISATANITASLCAEAYRQGSHEALDRATAVRALLAAGPLVPRVKAAIAVLFDDRAFAAVLPPQVALTPAEQDHLAGEVNAAFAGGVASIGRVS